MQIKMDTYLTFFFHGVFVNTTSINFGGVLVTVKISKTSNPCFDNSKMNSEKVYEPLNLLAIDTSAITMSVFFESFSRSLNNF